MRSAGVNVAEQEEEVSDSQSSKSPRFHQSPQIEFMHGRGHDVWEKPQHPWFEWASESLRQRAPCSSDSVGGLSLTSSYTMIDADVESDQSFEAISRRITVGDVLKGPKVVKRMTGWLRRRMSIS